MRPLLFTLIAIFSVIHPFKAYTDEKVSQSVTVPNPLELERDWWQYFDIKEDALAERIDALRSHLDTQLSVLKDEQHTDILEQKNETLFTLRLLQKKVNAVAPVEAPRNQFLKEYTFPEFLDVKQRLIQTQNEIAHLSSKIDSEKPRVARTQAQLDREILRYHTLSPSSHERLLTGLKIMQNRAELALHSAELERLTRSLSRTTKELSLLKDEIKYSRDHLTLEGLSRNTLVDAGKQSSRQLDAAQSKLKRLERTQLHVESEELKSELLCCIDKYRFLTQSIDVENIGIQNLLNDIKLSLYDFVDPSVDVSTETVKSQLTEWRRALSGAREARSRWQQELDTEHSKVSKIITQQLVESDNDTLPQQGLVTSIHLELDRSFALLDRLDVHIAHTELLVDALENRLLEERTLSETWQFKLESTLANTWNEIKERTSVTLFYIHQHPVTLSVLLHALSIIVGSLFLSKYIRHLLSQRLHLDRRFTSATQFIILRLTHYGIIIISIVVALNVIGLDLTNLAIVAGALGVGIGFGLQSMVNNVLSGLILLLNRYLKVGDVIEMQGGVFAKIKAINLQYTHIATFDGADLILPNAQLSNSGITNWTMQNTFRRYKVGFGVAYGTDKEKLRDVILEGVKKQSYVLCDNPRYPDPQVWLVGFGDSSVKFELVAWVNLSAHFPHGIASTSLLWEIDSILKENGIVVPFPQRDLYIKQAPPNAKGGQHPFFEIPKGEESLTHPG